jgi:hypothetical protein
MVVSVTIALEHQQFVVAMVVVEVVEVELVPTKLPDSQM